jgi:DNA-binding transcriptional ArsR family regulator
MRAQNSGLLVELIWAEREISRVEISRRTGLSPSTVSMIVASLEEAGLVREIGTQSSARGRRPTLLTFCDDVFNIVGVEIGIRHIAVVLTDLRGRVRSFKRESNDMRRGPGNAGEGARSRQRFDQREPPAQANQGTVWRYRARSISRARCARESPLPAWKGYDIVANLENRSSFRCPSTTARTSARSPTLVGRGVGLAGWRT